MTPVFERRGEVFRRRWSLLLGALLPYAGAIFLAWLGAPRWGVFVEAALAWMLGAAFYVPGYRHRKKGLVRVDGTGLWLDGERMAPRASLVNAFVLSTGQPIVRVVRRKAPSLDVQLAHDADGHALVQALGFGVGQSISSFSAWTPFLHVRADIGTDGILLRRFRGERFLPYGEVVGARVLDGVVVLELASGRNVHLLMSDPHARQALVDRVEQERLAFALSDAPKEEVHVAPGGRSVDRWVRDLRAIPRGPSYRVAGDAETLWRLVDDPSAPPAARAGAAVALSTLDDESRLRLRVAAEACAEPRLRVALTRLAEGAPDATLEEALEPLLEAKS